MEHDDTAYPIERENIDRAGLGSFDPYASRSDSSNFESMIEANKFHKVERLGHVRNEIRDSQKVQLEKQNKMFILQSEYTSAQKAFCDEQESYSGKDLPQQLLDRQGELLDLQYNLLSKQQALDSHVEEIQNEIRFAQERISALSEEILKLQRTLIHQ